MDEEARRLRQLHLKHEFWRAVLAMRNHVIVHCRADYLEDQMSGPWKDSTLWWAINIVGDQLDNAIVEGWLDSEE
jgi:hypothetical protein